MKRRVLIIVLAVALAAAGTGGVLAYVKNADARAIAGMKAVSVLVAQKAIPPGTTAQGALHAGSQIAVFDTVGSGTISGQPGCTGPHAQVAGTNRTRMVLPKVLVLSVGAATAAGTAGSAAITSTSSAPLSSSGSSSGQA